MPVKSDGFYHIDDAIELGGHYTMVFGERSSGKSYSSLEYFLKEIYAKDPSRELVVLRRYSEDFKGENASGYFNDMVANGIIEEVTKGKWNEIFYRGRKWYLSHYDEDKMKRVVDSKPLAHAVSINNWERKKSNPFPNVQMILFEEFLSRQKELVDEFVSFMNIISTVVRRRDDVKIVMLGNTVNPFSIYFKEFGLRKIREMIPGDIDTYYFGKDKKTKFVVEYTESASDKGGKKSDVYFAFDNPKLKMITHGYWEMELFPHLPCKYLPKDVIFQYFILYEEYVMHCEVINLKDGLFTYVHRKTTPIQDESKDLVFSTDYSHKPNFRRRITNPPDDLGRKILKQFADERVFYQDNEVGEIVRNYLLWCKNQKYA